MVFVFLGVTGAVLITLGALGARVNQTAIKITLEIIKYGSVLYLLNMLSKLF